MRTGFSGRGVDDGMGTLRALITRVGLSTFDVIIALEGVNVVWAAKLTKMPVVWKWQGHIEANEYPPQEAPFPGEMPDEHYSGYVTVPTDIIYQLAGMQAVSISVPGTFPRNPPAARGFLFDGYPQEANLTKGGIAELCGTDEDGIDWVRVSGLWLHSLDEVYVANAKADAVFESLRHGPTRGRTPRRATGHPERPPGIGISAVSDAAGSTADVAGGLATATPAAGPQKSQLIMAALLAICSKRDREHGKRGQPTKDSVAKEAWALLDQHDQRTGAGWATRAGVKESTLRQNFAAWLVASGASAANGDKVILGALVQLAMDPNVRLDLTDAADVCAAVRKKRRKRLTGHHAGDFVATIEAALVFARDIADHASD